MERFGSARVKNPSIEEAYEGSPVVLGGATLDPDRSV